MSLSTCLCTSKHNPVGVKDATFSVNSGSIITGGGHFWILFGTQTTTKLDNMNRAACTLTQWLKKKAKTGWCQSHQHVWADTSWVTLYCLPAKAAVWAGCGTTEDKDVLHVVFTLPWRLLLVLYVWKWECEVAARLRRPKIKRRGYLCTWHLQAGGGVHLLSFLPSASPAILWMFNTFYAFNLGLDNCKGAKGECDFSNTQILLSLSRRWFHFSVNSIMAETRPSPR